jgi:hypothetical protein
MITVLFYYLFFFHLDYQKEMGKKEKRERKKEICVIYLYKFKFGQSRAQTAGNLNKALSEETVNECIVQICFKKFHSGDLSSEDEEGQETSPSH